MDSVLQTLNQMADYYDAMSNDSISFHSFVFLEAVSVKYMTTGSRNGESVKKLPSFSSIFCVRVKQDTINLFKDVSPEVKDSYIHQMYM